MPQNKFQQMVFAFITVLITVHAYVFYSVYVINGETIMENTGASSVLSGVSAQGGVMMFGRMMPIWAVILIEFIFAYALENLVGSPLSFKLACRVFDPAKNHPMLFESAIICATVGIMCPVMSFIAAWLYYPYPYHAFNILTLLANWLKLMCYNFPFAYFTQMFFIQPFVRVAFKFIFRKEIAEREKEQHMAKESGKQLIKPTDEAEAIEDVWKRIDELQEELNEERNKRKELQEKGQQY